MTADAMDGIRSALSLRDLARLLFKWRRLVTSVFVASLALSLVGSYVAPRIYEAYSTVYVERNVAPVAAYSPESYRLILERKEVLSSEVDFIQSRAVQEKAAERLLAEREAARAREKPPSLPTRVVRGIREAVVSALTFTGLRDPGDKGLEDTIAFLRSGVKAKPALNSNIITISFRGEDPEYATLIVNTVTRAYIEERLAVMRRPGLDAFYQEQLDRSRTTLEELKRREAELKKETGVVSVEGEIRLKLEELSRLRSDLNRVQSEANELSEKIGALEAQVQAQPETVTVMRMMQRNPTIDELERKRLELEAQKANELNRFPADSRPIRELDESIRRIQEALAQEPRTILDNESLADNTIRTDLEKELFRTRAELSAKEARKATLLAQIRVTEGLLRELDQSATALDRLSDAIADAERIHSTYVERGENARIADETNPGTTNVSIVHYATPPVKPLYSRLTMIAAGALLGLLMGLGLAFVAELFDHSLNTRDDVERHLGVPLLASLPDSDALARRP
jgi:uncharacterized protein involved in exopolysaccharide biosynthesis